MSKIIFVTDNDWANAMYNHAKALRTQVCCGAIKLNPHIFKYKEEVEIVSIEQMIEEVKAADTVLFYHSNTYLFRTLLPFLAGKNIIAYHGGTEYRQNNVEIDKVFNPFISASITCHTEFMVLGAKNLHYVATAVDTESIKPADNYEVTRPYKIAHYPSNSAVKGSSDIIRMTVQAAQRYATRAFDFYYSDTKVAHADQLKRMAECDIYVELFASTQNGNPYGCYGVTAFEAAALGKVVITQNFNPDVYKDAYGVRCAFTFCSTEERFVSTIMNMGLTYMEGIRERQKATREWVVKNHSYVATGAYLRRILEI